MESLVAVSALDSCSFSLAAEADELFSMDQVLESFADSEMSRTVLVKLSIYKYILLLP